MCNIQQNAVRVRKFSLLICQQIAISKSPTHSRQRPIIEDCCSSIYTAETFMIHSPFAEFLSTIKHKRIGPHQDCNRGSRDCLITLSRKEITCYTLFIMIFEEVEHMFVDIIRSLPPMGDFICTTCTRNDTPQTIIHADFIIKIVETICDICAIL